MPVPTMHFVPYDALGVRFARALCGTLVRRQFEHANEPTCATCATLVAEQNAPVDVEDVFGAPTPGTQVVSTLANPLSGYRPRGASR